LNKLQEEWKEEKRALQEERKKWEKLANENKRIMEENKVLLSEKAEIIRRLNSLEAAMNEEKMMRDMFDLGFMFRYYHPCPLSSRSWSELVNDITEMKIRLEDSEISQQDFEKWIEPLNKKVNFDLGLLQIIGRIRNQISHTDIRSQAKQREFLARLESNLNLFPLKYRSLGNQMITYLKTVRLKRMN